jgi:PEP-CTERM motif
LTDIGGRVTIGGVDDDDPVPDLTIQVFRGAMTPNFPPPPFVDYGHDDPGFFAELSPVNPNYPAGASALPTNADVTVNFPTFTVGGLTDNLFFWDGSGGAVDFQPISTAQPGFAIDIYGDNPIGQTDGNGMIHEHPTWALDDGDTATPLDGVYLSAPTISVAGLADSKPFFIVWAVDHLIPDDDTVEALEDALDNDNPPIVAGKDFSYVNQAVSYVQNNLVVPEPSSLLLAGLACVGIASAAARKRTSCGRKAT